MSDVNDQPKSYTTHIILAVVVVLIIAGVFYWLSGEPEPEPVPIVLPEPIVEVVPEPASVSKMVPEVELTPDERRAKVFAEAFVEEHMTQLREVFDKCDTNGDGHVSKFELARKLRACLTRRVDAIAFQAYGFFSDAKNDYGSFIL